MIYIKLEPAEKSLTAVTGTGAERRKMMQTGTDHTGEKHDHEEKAARLFREGMNCAQSVFVAFSDVTGLDEDLAKRISSSFGAGMGRMREVCGTCTSMFMVLGVLYGDGTEKDDKVKTAHYKRIQDLAEEFRSEHETIICRDLLKGLSVTNTPEPEKRTEEYYKVRPCVKFVRTAARILERYIEENPPV